MDSEKQTQKHMWPTLDQYQSAVQHPECCFQHPFLKVARVEKRQYGCFSLPFAQSGNFGAVYRFYTPEEKSWAVKVFIREQPERHDRYKLISRTIGQLKPKGFLDFEYDNAGIQICGEWFPILIMEWTNGKTLAKNFEDIFRTGERVDNSRLCRNWISLICGMQEKNIAHGDLQHGNILISEEDELTIVDYDGMYVPLLEGKKSVEIGLPSYQHPHREIEFFNPRMDDFSASLILLQLMVVEKPLWDRFHKDDNYLIVGREDLVDPARSEFFSAFLGLSEKVHGKKKKLAEIVCNAAKSDIGNVPPFPKVIREIEVESHAVGLPDKNGEGKKLPPEIPLSESGHRFPKPLPSWLPRNGPCVQGTGGGPSAQESGPSPSKDISTLPTDHGGGRWMRELVGKYPVAFERLLAWKQELLTKVEPPYLVFALFSSILLLMGLCSTLNRAMDSRKVNRLERQIGASFKSDRWGNEWAVFCRLDRFLQGRRVYERLKEYREILERGKIAYARYNRSKHLDSPVRRINRMNDLLEMAQKIARCEERIEKEGGISRIYQEIEEEEKRLADCASQKVEAMKKVLETMARLKEYKDFLPLHYLNMVHIYCTEIGAVLEKPGYSGMTKLESLETWNNRLDNVMKMRENFEERIRGLLSYARKNGLNTWENELGKDRNEWERLFKTWESIQKMGRPDAPTAAPRLRERVEEALRLRQECLDRLEEYKKKGPDAGDSEYLEKTLQEMLRLRSRYARLDIFLLGADARAIQQELVQWHKKRSGDILPFLEQARTLISKMARQIEESGRELEADWIWISPDGKENLEKEWKSFLEETEKLGNRLERTIVETEIEEIENARLALQRRSLLFFSAQRGKFQDIVLSRKSAFDYNGKNASGHLQFTHRKTGMEFVSIPSGTYGLGNRKVFLKSYLIGKYEVTEQEWNRVLGVDRFSNWPITRVSFYDCQRFCKSARLRLPSSDEWEAACRAGKKEQYAWGEEYDFEQARKQAWVFNPIYSHVYGSGTKYPKGLRPPNGFGLHDMIGNVWEWVEERGRGYLCGGAFSPSEGEKTLNPEVYRFGYKKSVPPSREDIMVGFRCACSWSE